MNREVASAIRTEVNERQLISSLFVYHEERDIREATGANSFR